MKIVVPYDFSDISAKAIYRARNMTGQENIWIVHVLEPLEVTEPGVVWDSKETSDESRKEHAAAEIKKLLDAESLDQVQIKIRIGDPAKEITQFATEIGADLIVIASQGKTGLERILLGSVAESVVRYARCSVLVIK